MAGERGQPLTRPGKAVGHPQEATTAPANLIKAIQTTKAFVRSANWPERAKNAWKRVKEAVFNQLGHDASDASRDIQELKTQVKGLTDLIKGFTKPNTAPTSYVD